MDRWHHPSPPHHHQSMQVLIMGWKLPCPWRYMPYVTCIRKLEIHWRFYMHLWGWIRVDVHSFQPLKVRYCYRSALQVHIDPLPGLGVATEAPWNQAMIAVDLLFLGAQPYGNMMLACRNFSKRCCSLCRVLMGVVPIDPCEPHSTPGGWCTTHWVYCAYPGFGAISRVQWAVWVAQWWTSMEQQVSQVRWGSWSWYLVVGHQFDGCLTSSPHHGCTPWD